MKKILLFAGMAALLASCANQETVEVAQSNAIGFNAYVGKATKADVTKDNLESFDVYGYYGEGTVVFDGVGVSKSGSSWAISGETKYWVPGQVYNFAAVAPSVTTATFDADGLVLTGYESTGTDDLIVAVTSSITAQSTGNDAVELNFKHALAKVNLVLNNVGEQNVSDVQLNGVISKGTLTATATDLDWDPTTTETKNYEFTVENNSRSLYLIPQTIGEDVTVTLTVDNDPREYPVPTSAVQAWETGKVYSYTIDLEQASEQQAIEVVVGDVDNFGGQDSETLEPEGPEGPAVPEELTGKIYIDFGNKSEDNTDSKWNHFRTDGLSEETLKYEDGQTDSPLKITTNDLIVYAGAGSESSNFTSSEIEWPVGVWADSFIVNYGTTGTIKISGLNQNQKVNITVLATRYNASRDARETEFKIGEETHTINQGIRQEQFSQGSFDFNDLTCTFENIIASEGQIEIEISALKDVSTQPGCISAMVISPATAVED